MKHIILFSSSFFYFSMKRTMPKILISIFFLSSLSHPQTDSLSINNVDYRSRINIPEYNPSLMPLNYNNRSTGVWTELNPNVPRVDYLSIDFIGIDAGWAVGANGAIIKTTNAGQNWETKQSNTTKILLNVNSFNGDVVIAAGYDGTIVRSTDGGESFVQVTSGVGNGIDLWGLKMINDTLGWICGLNNTLLKTIDGGLNWQIINTGFIGFDYWTLNFLNETIGYIACGNGNILKTTDGGESWQLINVGENIQLYTITVFDSLNFLAAGQKNGTLGRVAYTSDGGNSFGYSNAGYLVESISFANDTLGYAVGSEHVLYRTINKGRNWEFINFSEVGEFCIKFLNDSIAYQAGRGLKINKTTDTGYDWFKSILNDNFTDVYFYSETTGFVLSGSLYKTTTGGLSWLKIENAPGGNTLLFLDSLTGFIGGSQTLFKTTDGGVNWYNVNGVPGGVGKIFFINSVTGWAASGRNIINTTDGGENWITQITLPSDNFSSLYFIDSLNGWATSRYIWQTTDGGVNWSQQNYLPSDTHDDVYFANKDTGWISHYSSINTSLFKTTDGGENWLNINEVTGARKFYFFPNPIHWIILGFSRYYITIDSGFSWIEFTSEVPMRLNSFNAPNNNLGFAIGSTGLILNYEDTTYVPVELISFSVESNKGLIELKWTTATETNNRGFEILRSTDNENWDIVGFITGNGTTTFLHAYQYTDEVKITGNYYYQLKQVDYNGEFDFSPTIEVRLVQPSDFILYQNFPNPFNPNTKITFEIPFQIEVRIILYDVTGQEIKTITNQKYEAGFHSVVLNADDLSSGVYLYRMTTLSGYTAVKKLTIIK